ncbi:MAG: single-strand selective monofunctional uracil DNA glycosylase [Pseudohongiellaceae bacterium]|jgi:single-strand selective monofunctional uracil DNA glycosylase
MSLITITRRLSKRVDALSFALPVTHVYNPLEYARPCHDTYLRRFGHPGIEALLLGMNPGPFGMSQTGVPFGEVAAVRNWMGISGKIGRPHNEHPKRQIQGFDCPRSEVSGRRMWEWAAGHFDSPEAFFERFFVWNFCPLVFLEESGRNHTPDKLPRAERESLFAVCDKALQEVVALLKPQRVIGVGAFAEARARLALADGDVEFGRVLHPSPASPLANRGWAEAADRQFAEMGIALP